LPCRPRLAYHATPRHASPHDPRAMPRLPPPMLRHLLPGSRPSVKAAGLKCCGNSSLLPSHRSPKARGGGCAAFPDFPGFFPGFCAWAVRFPRGWSKARGHASAPRSLLRGRSRWWLARWSHGRAAEERQPRAPRRVIDFGGAVHGVITMGAELAGAFASAGAPSGGGAAACGSARRRVVGNDDGIHPAVKECALESSTRTQGTEARGDAAPPRPPPDPTRSEPSSPAPPCRGAKAWKMPS
jgi:hypothetical protein